MKSYFAPPDHVPSAFDAVMQRHGWSATAGEGWDVHWGETYRELGVSPDRIRHARHFHAAQLLGGKASLGRHLEAARSRAAVRGDARAWDFFPRTYEWPAEREVWQAHAAAQPGQLWIAKPVTKGRGIGHYLFRDPAQAPHGPGWVVQEYLTEPHLIGGVKYTLRNFVVVTSLRPLVAHLSTRGLAKRCALPYSNAPEHWADRAVHLSNSEVQHRVPTGRLPVWQLDEFAEILAREGGDYAQVWAATRRLSALTLLAVRESWLKANPPVAGDLTRRFEFLGLDVMLDAQFKPWLLEVNANPSIRVGGDRTAPSVRAEWEMKLDVTEEALQLAGALPGGPAGSLPAHRFGSYELLFPAAETAEWGEDWFPRAADRHLARALGWPAPDRPQVRLPAEAKLAADGLVAFVPPCDRLLALNETATAIAFLHEEGNAPAAIAGALREAGAPEDAPLEEQIDEVLAEVWSFGVAQRPRASVCAPGHRGSAPMGASARHYALGELDFVVCCEHPETAAHVDPYLRHLELSTARGPAHVVEVRGGPREFQVITAREVLEVREPEVLVATLHSALLRLACCSPGVLLALHASVVEIGGRAVVFPGRSGRGKTTLAAALVQGGAGLLSDEVALLGRDFLVWPAPVCLGLTEGSLPLLPEAMAADRLAPQRRRDGTAVHYLRPRRLVATPLPLGAIVFPAVQPGVATRLEPLGLRATLAALGQGGIEFPATLSAAEARELIERLDGTRRHTLHLGSLAEAQRVLNDAFAFDMPDHPAAN